MSLSAVLLAGGKSSRMGQDKATVIFRGRPLWERQLGTLRTLDPDKISVSAQVDPPWRPREIDFVADAQPARGPLSGIAAALSCASSDHLLVLAIDMPLMTNDYLRGLCQRVAPDCGIVPMSEERAEPLAAVYPRSVSDNFAAALSGNDFSLQALLRNLIGAGRLLPISVSDEEKALFRNLNEPGDLDLPGCS